MLEDRFSHSRLKTIQREIRERFPESLSLRVHRALSWLQRAEGETEDPDSRFIFLWIAFNAAYANDLEDRESLSERKLFVGFLDKLIGLDNESLLYTLVWQQFPSAIRLFLNNPYVFQPFWQAQRGELSEEEWRRSFEGSKKAANNALGAMDTLKALSILFDRLYVLRNQLIHGGATWNSAVNRDQIGQGADIMGFIVPIIIHLMMMNPNELWGDACYPVVD